MSIWNMSIFGAAMILVIVVIRTLAINRLPKKTFLALWGIALIRLLIPYSLPSVFSICSLLGDLNAPSAVDAQVPDTSTARQPVTAFSVSDTDPAAAVTVDTSSPVIDTWIVVWAVGVLVCMIFFAVTYWKCRRKFRESLPVKNGFAENWLISHKLRRTVEIRQTDRISSPLTYGVFRPVILLPKRIDWEDETLLSYVLAHEYVHIRRFDAVTKLMLTAALCVHWFNPTVWIMYILANRDLELSCDEAVVRLFGEHTKSAYAMALIRMEETKSGLSPLYNNFSKNAIEERIVAIMKTKRISWASAMAAILLVAGVTTAFATTVQTEAAQYEYDNTALSAEEPDNNTAADLEWWTVEEYEEWLKQEKADLQSIIGEKCWNPTEGWYTWTQEKVDETIAMYEQTLQELKDGKMVSKPTYDTYGEVTMIQFSYDSKGNETATETKEAYSSADNDDQVLSSERLAEYETFGLTCDKSAETLYYNGKSVRYFTDSVDIDGNIFTAYQYWNGEGTVDIHTVRKATKNADGSYDPFGKLIGIEEYKAGELDLDSLFTASTESIAQGGTSSESAYQSGQAVSVASDYYIVESGDTVAEFSVASDDYTVESGNIDTEFMEEIAKYAPFGVNFVKSGDFGNLYWNGEPVDVLIDCSPDGKYMTVSSTDEGGIKIQTVYDSSGKLIGVEAIEN